MSPQQPRDDENKPEEPIVVKDKRRVDPESGQVRAETTEETVEPAGPPPGEPGSALHAEGTVVSVEGAPVEGAPTGVEAPDTEAADTEGVASSLQEQLEERTADLKRLQAEYTNYRRRVERDREAAAENAKASLVGDMLPLLDDIERTDAHGDLTGAFKAVADKLLASLDKAGLASYGEVGEAFDPAVHEAVQHTTSPEVSGPTVTSVLRRGYRLGERVLRPAMVGVTDHEPADAAGATGPIPTAEAGAGTGDGSGSFAPEPEDEHGSSGST